MKKFTKIVSLLAASALLVLLPDSNVLTASADSANTFSFAYVEDEEKWCYQLGSSFDEDGDYWTIDEINEVDELPDIKDGDTVIIYGDKEHGDKIKIPARLSNLTILKTGSAVIVSTHGITDCFVGAGSVAAVNGDIQNAYLYDDAQVTFNNNIGNLDINSEEDGDCIATCSGSVGHLVIHYEDSVYYDVYNIAAGELYVEDSELETDDKYYSTTPSATPAGPAATPAPQAGGNNTSSDDYDDVPKTGESPVVFLLLAAAAICFAGSRSLKRI